MPDDVGVVSQVRCKQLGTTNTATVSQVGTHFISPLVASLPFNGRLIQLLCLLFPFNIRTVSPGTKPPQFWGASCGGFELPITRRSTNGDVGSKL